MQDKYWTGICNLGSILHEIQENYWSRNSNLDSVLMLGAQWNTEVLI
jgi:hypothetical protein